MATPKWLEDVMDKSSRAGGMARSRANAPTKKELQKANEQAKEYLTNIGLTMLPVGLVGTKVGQALAKGYGKAIAGGITNTLKRGGSSPRTKINWDLPSKTSDTMKVSPGFIVKMKPDEYLNLIPKTGVGKSRHHIYKDSKEISKYKNVLKAMKKGNKFDIPDLKIEEMGSAYRGIGRIAGYKISRQEGRHRAEVARALGAKSIPVHIMLPDKKKYWDMIGYGGGGTKKTGKNYLQKKLSKAQNFKKRYGK